MHDPSFRFTAKLWRWQGAAPAAWHFVTLPVEVASQVRFFGSAAPGFGMVKVAATIGKTRFETSVFPDKKSGSFLLPVKAAVRKAEKIGDGDEIEVKISTLS